MGGNSFEGPGSVTVTVTGVVAISRKKLAGPVLFLAGQSQSHIAIEVGKRGFRTDEILRLADCRVQQTRNRRILSV